MTFWITTMLALLYDLLGQFSPAVLMLRIEETVIGVAVAILVLPTNTRTAIREATRKLLKALSELIEICTATLCGSQETIGLTEQARQLDRTLQQFRITAKPLLAGVAGLAGRGTIRRGLRVFTACDRYGRTLARRDHHHRVVGTGVRASAGDPELQRVEGPPSTCSANHCGCHSPVPRSRPRSWCRRRCRRIWCLGNAITMPRWPLDDFLDEVMRLLENDPGANEIQVERVKFLRYGEARGDYDEVVAGLNASDPSNRHFVPDVCPVVSSRPQGERFDRPVVTTKLQAPRIRSSATPAATSNSPPAACCCIRVERYTGSPSAVKSTTISPTLPT